jgi:hypothetical protein
MFEERILNHHSKTNSKEATGEKTKPVFVHFWEKRDDQSKYLKPSKWVLKRVFQWCQIHHTVWLRKVVKTEGRLPFWSKQIFLEKRKTIF